MVRRGRGNFNAVADAPFGEEVGFDAARHDGHSADAERGEFMAPRLAGDGEGAFGGIVGAWSSKARQ